MISTKGSRSVGWRRRGEDWIWEERGGVRKDARPRPEFILALVEGGEEIQK